MPAGVPTSLEAASAAPRTIRLGNRDLVFRPFRLSDFGALKRWVNEQLPHPCKAAREVAEQFGATKEERTELMMKAYEDLKRGEYAIDDPRCLDVMRSPLGVAYVLWLGVRRDTPTITLDDVVDLISDLSMAEINDLSSFVQGVDPADPTLPPMTVA